MATMVADDAADVAVARDDRLREIDLMRGLVIALMALDHVRDFFLRDAFAFDPLDVERTSAALYATRWVTHLCAPTFVVLAGVAAFLHGRRRTSGQLARFVATRGLWLIVLEFTVMSLGWSFAFPRPFLQVIWAIGWSMLLLAPLVRLGPGVTLAVGVAIIAGHNLLDPVTPASSGMPILWRFLHEGGFAEVGGQPVALLAYPIVPWVGVIALGYGLGPVFTWEAGRRRRLLSVLALAMLATFVALRLAHGYGDPSDWVARPGWAATLGDALDVQKYPPSLHYVLVTLGLAFLILPRLARARGALADVLVTFGRAPLFFYVLHVYLIHALAVAAATLAGFPPGLLIDQMVNMEALIASGWGVPLWGVYAVWLVVLAMLWPACRWFAAVKARRRDPWLSYL